MAKTGAALLQSRALLGLGITPADLQGSQIRQIGFLITWAIFNVLAWSRLHPETQTRILEVIIFVYFVYYLVFPIIARLE